jgi:cyanophycinase-like exopeptidase
VTRLLVIMGSGETSPTMVKTHREVFARIGGAARAVLLDTPFGFQENADDIAARALDYFERSVGRSVEVASFRRADGMDPLQRESTLAQISQAGWVFAGPGSPTYTLRQWAGTEIPSLLAEKLQRGGVVNFASAAALTLGAVTVPVYEIYKVGADVKWAPGLDLLGPLGLPVAVIPHYDNAEGGNHDTRFCYLGERRLRMLEAQLPSSAFVLGVDEHTGCVFDLDAGTAAVVGLGQVTVRRHGVSTTVASGSTFPISALVDLAMALGEGRPAEVGTGAGAAEVLGVTEPESERESAAGASRGPGAGPNRESAAGASRGPGAGPNRESGPSVGPSRESGPSVGPSREPSPMLAAIREQEAVFEAAIGCRDVDGAVRAILAVDETLVAWSADTLQSDEQDRGRGVLRRMIVRLGDVARVGARDPRAVIGPYVSQLLALRASARGDRRFEEADGIRDQLVALGVSVHDTGEGTEWDPPELSG